MYVCVCKAVTDTQIKRAIDNGLCTRRQLFDCFGVGGDCGKCNRQVKELLDASKQNQFIMDPMSTQPVYTAC
ncbi:MAG: (2Fe-2S)-binding protein [Methylomicrobium sp.]